MGEEKREAVGHVVEKLVTSDFIKKAHYTTWLANVVMVQKQMVSGEYVLIIPT